VSFGLACQFFIKLTIKISRIVNSFNVVQISCSQVCFLKMVSLFNFVRVGNGFKTHTKAAFLNNPK